MSEVRFVPRPPCLLCRGREWLEEGQEFCPKCAERIRSMGESPCRACGEPAKSCVCTANAWLKFLLWYDEPTAKTFVARLKNDPRAEEVRYFGRELAKLCTGRYDSVTFVPRQPKEARRHGSDHAKLLAEAVAEALDLPLVSTMECRAVTMQKFLSASQREKLMQGRFVVKDEVFRDHKRLLLIDDVSTTGATLRVTSALLRSHGAETVSCAALCKTRENFR